MTNGLICFPLSHHSILPLSPYLSLLSPFFISSHSIPSSFSPLPHLLQAVSGESKRRYSYAAGGTIFSTGGREGGRERRRRRKWRYCLWGRWFISPDDPGGMLEGGRKEGGGKIKGNMKEKNMTNFRKIRTGQRAKDWWKARKNEKEGGGDCNEKF